jgi:hypothetical protein
MKPDWRKPCDYDFCENLDMSGWAWEFLRRNPRYLDDWKRAKVAYQGKRNSAIQQRYGERWGLYRIINPTNNKPRLVWTISENPVVVTRGSHEFLHLKNKTKIALGFDVARSIPKQLATAKKYLQQIQGDLKANGNIEIISGRNRKGKWTCYIRVFDAKSDASKPANAEIANIVFNIAPEANREERLKNAQKALKILIDKDGYKSILFS